MDWFEAAVLGLVQGLTEFLPVSSSGHLLIVKELFGITAQDAAFEIVVHFATVLSTCIVFWKVIRDMAADVLRFRRSPNTLYFLRIAVALIPIMVVGFFFKDAVEGLFVNGIAWAPFGKRMGTVGLVGFALLLTASLLLLSRFLRKPSAAGAGRKPSAADAGRPIGYGNAFIIGVAQALAVIPGLSRSGATISAGLLMNNRKDELAQFSFLIVLPPVIGETLLSLFGGDFAAARTGIPPLSLAIGFLTAFVSGLFACKLMVALVKRAKLGRFGWYCALLGLGCIVWSMFKP